ncbi:MAG TPA: hypothetical protein VGI10_15225 [Polyangiaceae bacterium]|jgi:hypothetical protein
MTTRSVALAGALCLTLFTARSRACGVSASGVSSCSLAEHNEAVRPRWAVGVSGLYTSTSLRFSGSQRADEIRYATLASLAYMPTDRWVLQLGAGATFDGSLTLPDGKHDFSPGPIGSLGADYRLYDDERVFLLFTSLLSFSAARTHLAGQSSVGYEAFDLRVGAEFGVDVAKVLRPYALARAFGGPVYWRYQGSAVTGTDTHHYQFGAGFALLLSKRVNAFAEGVPLGERAVSLGIGSAF